MTKKKSDQPIGYKYKYKRLYDLGADRIGIVDNMLIEGCSSMSVAERIQGDWGECVGVKIGTLEKQILRYKKDIVEPRLLVAVEKAEESGVSISKGMKKFREQVDVMETLNEVINMQRGRIAKMFAAEEEAGNKKLTADIQRELRPFTDMLKVLSSLQLETGVVRRVPKQIQGIWQQLGHEELAEFRIEMTQNDDTLRALSDLKNIVEEAASEIIDGEYIPVASEPEALPEHHDDVVGPEAS